MKSGLMQVIVRVIQIVWLYSKNLVVNVWRRLVILGKYALLCLQQQKIRRSSRRLGKSIFTALEEGNPDPLLQEDVKAHLDTLKNLQEKKMAQREGISRIRERIRETSYALPSQPAEEAPSETHNEKTPEAE